MSETKFWLTHGYKAYISSPEWKAKRSQAFAIHGRVCALCGKRGTHVHHLTYERFRAELVSDLQILCSDCHEGVEEGKTKERHLRGERAKYMAGLETFSEKLGYSDPHYAQEHYDEWLEDKEQE